MKILKSIFGIILITLVFNCSRNKLEPKGFAVAQETEIDDNTQINGFSSDSLIMETKPGSVILTGNKQYRLTPIYKVNFDKRNKTTFIGYTDFYRNYLELGSTGGNEWHHHFMPGLEAGYGYNMVNVSHFDHKTQTQKLLFEKPVLIKTLYFPSFITDTLNGVPVNRNFYLISVYNRDSNGDGFINGHDIRRLYYLDLNSSEKISLIPEEYSVTNSEYDSENDYMYVFAKLDGNKNGKCEDNEATHIFWIDLKNPGNNGRMY